MVGILDAIVGVADTVGSFIAGDKAADAAQTAANSASDTNAIVRQIAQQVLDASLANIVDAQGNQITYDPSTNTFRAIPSPTTQEIIDASQTEELRALTDDAGRARILRELAFGNRVGANQAASTFLDNLASGSPYNAGDIESALREKTRLTTNETFDNARQDLIRQATRSGTLSNTGDILGQLARRQNDQLREADIDSYINSLGAAEDLETSRVNRNLTPYLNLSNVASTTEPVQPSGVADVLSSRLSAKQNTVPQAAGVANAGLVNAGAVNTNAQRGLADPNLYNPQLLPGIAQNIANFSNIGRGSSADDRRSSGNTTSNPNTTRPGDSRYQYPSFF